MRPEVFPCGMRYAVAVFVNLSDTGVCEFVPLAHETYGLVGLAATKFIGRVTHTVAGEDSTSKSAFLENLHAPNFRDTLPYIHNPSVHVCAPLGTASWPSGCGEPPAANGRGAAADRWGVSGRRVQACERMQRVRGLVARIGRFR